MKIRFQSGTTVVSFWSPEKCPAPEVPGYNNLREVSAVERFRNELRRFQSGTRPFHFCPRTNARHWKSLEVLFELIRTNLVYANRLRPSPSATRIKGEVNLVL